MSQRDFKAWLIRHGFSKDEAHLFDMLVQVINEDYTEEMPLPIDEAYSRFIDSVILEGTQIWHERIESIRRAVKL